ncbi:MAG: acyl-CoA desaturase [Legionellales bacterium]|nr:acyl-CoA desaturase [Legionellales bacterium]|tara:strand:- start:18102 stop:19040 length:939 start_codon:yes stop_codon:yes gene_type:complete
MRKLLRTLRQWIDAHEQAPFPPEQKDAIDWFRVIPFIFLHVACLGVFFTGYSATALWVAASLYAVRIFSIGAFYHRYFSHKTYRTNRIWQFLFAMLGETAIQRGPLWWSAHHRSHHLQSDQPEDVHSPKQHSYLWSHMGWFLSKGNFSFDRGRVKDWQQYPELVWLDRYDILVPVVLAVGLFIIGHLLYLFAPALHTNGMQLLVWGFFISSVVSLHVTLSINSLAHYFGKKIYQTDDDSRNHWFLALLTFGEGWHNNHHRYPATAQQGFRWWQFDLTFYLLAIMEKLGIIWDLKRVPQRIIDEARSPQHETP